MKKKKDWYRKARRLKKLNKFGGKVTAKLLVFDETKQVGEFTWHR